MFAHFVLGYNLKVQCETQDIFHKDVVTCRGRNDSSFIVRVAVIVPGGSPWNCHVLPWSLNRTGQPFLLPRYINATAVLWLRLLHSEIRVCWAKQLMCIYHMMQPGQFVMHKTSLHCWLSVGVNNNTSQKLVPLKRLSYIFKIIVLISVSVWCFCHRHPAVICLYIICCNCISMRLVANRLTNFIKSERRLQFFFPVVHLTNVKSASAGS